MIASDELRKQRLLAAVRAAPSPTRQSARRAALAVLGVAAGLSLAVFLGSGALRRTPRPPLSSLLSSLGALPIAMGALVTAGRRGRSMLGRAPPLLWAVLLAVPYLLLGERLGMAALVGAWIPSPPGAAASSGLTPSALDCGLLLLSVALPPLCGLAWLRRDSEPRQPGTVGAALGVAAGAAAWVLLDLRCAGVEPRHLLLGHVLPLLALGLLGEGLGHLLLSVRGLSPRRADQPERGGLAGAPPRSAAPPSGPPRMC